IGFVPAMVMAILRRSVSEKVAFELIATGEDISADQAQECRLVNRVFEAVDFESEVEKFAGRFQKSSRSAIALSKRLFYQTDALAFEDALAAGVDANATARLTGDCKKGVARFLEK
ncbi:enoyl-CoA hydratase/isomerase family protein, partial [Patescibacteria group bacterium]